jgi:phage baseplate assembly protein W
MSSANMRGMSRFTGRSLGGDAHLRQSVADILATPLGSRVMRRD